MQICDFLINHKKISDLRLADWHTLKFFLICDSGMSLRICEFAICRLYRRKFVCQPLWQNNLASL